LLTTVTDRQTDGWVDGQTAVRSNDAS